MGQQHNFTSYSNFYCDHYCDLRSCILSLTQKVQKWLKQLFELCFFSRDITYRMSPWQRFNVFSVGWNTKSEPLVNASQLYTRHDVCLCVSVSRRATRTARSSVFKYTCASVCFCRIRSLHLYARSLIVCVCVCVCMCVCVCVCLCAHHTAFFCVTHCQGRGRRQSVQFRIVWRRLRQADTADSILHWSCTVPTGNLPYWPERQPANHKQRHTYIHL